MLFFLIYFRNLEIQVETLASISGDLYVHVEAFASLPPPSYAPAWFTECLFFRFLEILRHWKTTKSPDRNAEH